MSAADPLDPQVRAVLDTAIAEVAREPAAMRAGEQERIAQLGGAPEQVASVEERSEPVPLRVCAPAGARGTVLWLHGGGWVIGSIRTHDRVARMLANAAGARVVLPEYRLAPEHPYPAGLEDCEAALGVARSFGEPVGVAGDSAGGGLAAVLARRHRDLALQALVYPVCDTGMASASYETYCEGFGLTAEEMAWFVGQYGGDADDPDVSPLRARELGGLPPALIVQASHDVLRDEGEAYARRLREAGVEARVSVYPGTVHGFLRWTAKVDAARAAIDELGAALRAALA